jgi:hypothetical protein
MSVRTVVGIAAAMTIGTAIGTAVASRAGMSTESAARAVPVPRPEAPATVLPEPPLAVLETQAEADAVAWYDTVRDDINPKPRLQAIESRVRGAPRGEALGLLAHAMVDPDASVRERAQELFERRLADR